MGMKTLKWAAASTMMVSLLAGCGAAATGGGGQANGSNAQAAGGASSPSSPSTPQQKVTIKYNSWESGTTQDQINKIIAGFEKANPNIEVQYTPLVTNGSSTDYYKKLDVMAGTGEKFDVVAFSHVDFLTERAARGILAPLDDYLQADNIDPDKQFFINPKYKGKVYGIQDIASPWMVAINKDALDAAGLPAPAWGWTWDDFRAYAKKMTKGEGENKQYGAYFHTWGEYANMIAYSELPHPYLNKDGKPIFGGDSFKYFFNLRRAMEKDDQSVKPFSDIVGAKLSYNTEFFNGKAAMVPTASFFISQILDKNKFPHTFKTVFAPLPRSSKDAEIGLSYIGGHYLGVGTNSQHKKEAYQFIRYMAQQTDVIQDFPGSRNVDNSKVVNQLVGDNKNLIDIDSLSQTVYDKRVKIPYDPTYSAAYSSQLKTVLENGFAHFILDNQTADQAGNDMVAEANKVIQQNSK
jgi:multiple sugar transport system substrate-binding protein